MIQMVLGPPFPSIILLIETIWAFFQVFPCLRVSSCPKLCHFELYMWMLGMMW
jgi:hypothetical protein